MTIVVDESYASPTCPTYAYYQPVAGIVGLALAFLPLAFGGCRRYAWGLRLANGAVSDVYHFL